MLSDFEDGWCARDHRPLIFLTFQAAMDEHQMRQHLLRRWWRASRALSPAPSGPSPTAASFLGRYFARATRLWQCERAALTARGPGRSDAPQCTWLAITSEPSWHLTAACEANSLVGRLCYLQPAGVVPALRAPRRPERIRTQIQSYPRRAKGAPCGDALAGIGALKWCGTWALNASHHTTCQRFRSTAMANLEKQHPRSVTARSGDANRPLAPCLHPTRSGRRWAPCSKQWQSAPFRAKHEKFN